MEARPLKQEQKHHHQHDYLHSDFQREAMMMTTTTTTKSDSGVGGTFQQQQPLLSSPHPPPTSSSPHPPTLKHQDQQHHQYHHHSSYDQKQQPQLRRSSILMLSINPYPLSSSSSSLSLTPNSITTPPPSIRLFPQRHPRRYLVCIFLLLISGARLSSILNHHHNTSRPPPPSYSPSSSSFQETPEPPPLPSSTLQSTSICVDNPDACVGSTLAYVPQPTLEHVRTAQPGMQFLHGVASGDALSDKVMLSPNRPLRRSPLLTGHVITGPEVDYTIKIDLENLTPSTTYYYRFSVNSIQSPTGMTRTLPINHTNALNFAVVSCSNLPRGYFNAYANIARRENVDFVVHLGDYLYEYRNGEYGDGTELGRVPYPDRELVTLEDYRLRHAQYKEDQDLQALHRMTMNSSTTFAGGDSTAWTSSPRMPSALRAYFEYLPIRESPLRTSIYRTFHFGSLMDLILLDTRIIGRDESGVSNTTLLESESRTILGEEQEKWLEGELRESVKRDTKWRFLGNQVVFATMDHWGVGINADAWDGYPANRRRVMDFLVKEKHPHLPRLQRPYRPLEHHHLRPSTGQGSHLVEFVSPSVTSPSPLESIHLGFLNPLAERLLLSAEPHLKYIDLSRRGYMLLDVTEERVVCEYWYPVTVRRRMGEEVLGARVETTKGSGRITRMEVFEGEGEGAPVQVKAQNMFSSGGEMVTPSKLP
ncbi:PhoD-like phosphatase-domain-containing protein [Chytridium lagenaria]|nr:PhoD-like phosphatase-domain-containing protein [Chytridium lagenaria]